MKIALFTNEFPPHIYGGAGVHIDQASQLHRRLCEGGGAQAGCSQAGGQSGQFHGASPSVGCDACLYANHVPPCAVPSWCSARPHAMAHRKAGGHMGGDVDGQGGGTGSMHRMQGRMPCGLRVFFPQIHSPYDYCYFKLLNYSGFSVFFENPARPVISNLMGE